MRLVTLILAALSCVCSGRTLRNGTHTSISSLVEDLSKDVTSLVESKSSGLEEEIRKSAKRPCYPAGRVGTNGDPSADQRIVFEFCTADGGMAQVPGVDTQLAYWPDCVGGSLWMTDAVETAVGRVRNDDNEGYKISLQDMQIIGSHDAQSYPTSYEHRDNVGRALLPSSSWLTESFARNNRDKLFQGGVAQALNVGDQLRCGVRFLDIRMAWHAGNAGRNKLITHHKLRNAPVVALFTQIVDYLDELRDDNKEVITLRLKMDVVSDYPAARAALAECFRSSGLGSRLLTHTDFGIQAQSPSDRPGYDYTRHDIWGSQGMLHNPDDHKRRVIVIDAGDVGYKPGRMYGQKSKTGRGGVADTDKVTGANTPRMGDVLFKEQKGGSFPGYCCDLKSNMDIQTGQTDKGWSSGPAANNGKYKTVYTTITAFMSNHYDDPNKHYGSLKWATFCAVRPLLRCMIGFPFEYHGGNVPQPAWCATYRAQFKAVFDSAHLIMADFSERMGILPYARATTTSKVEATVRGQVQNPGGGFPITSFEQDGVELGSIGNHSSRANPRRSVGFKDSSLALEESSEDVTGQEETILEPSWLGDNEHEESELDVLEMTEEHHDCLPSADVCPDEPELVPIDELSGYEADSEPEVSESEGPE